MDTADTDLVVKDTAVVVAVGIDPAAEDIVAAGAADTDPVGAGIVLAERDIGPVVDIAAAPAGRVGVLDLDPEGIQKRLRRPTKSSLL